MPQINGLIFDFDGLILDTETPEFEVWSDIYSRHGASLSIEEWAVCLGSSPDAFDIIGHLQAQTGILINEEALRLEHKTRSLDLIQHASPLPGVVALLSYARQLGLPIGLASSSKRSWIEGHLKKINLDHFFDFIACQEDVAEVKPAPELYRLVLQQLRLNPSETVAFEDSPNGITAARQAEIFCVGVPNAVSRLLITNHADLLVSSLAEFAPPILLDIIQTQMQKNHPG